MLIYVANNRFFIFVLVLREVEPSNLHWKYNYTVLIIMRMPYYLVKNIEFGQNCIHTQIYWLNTFDSN